MGSPHSVRVELEESYAPESRDQPGPVGSSERRGVGVAAAVLALVGLLLGLLLLRPTDGQAADGSERQVPTSTISPESSRAVEPTERLSPRTTRTNSQSVGFLPVPEGIVATDDGFLGLGQGTPTHPFPLFQSDDGSEWGPVNATVDGIEPASYETEFSHLQRVEGGFAMLRTRGLGALDAEIVEGETAVDRLVSADGVSWFTDDRFANVLRSGDVSPVFHFDDVVGVASVPENVPIPLGGLFADALVPDSGVSADGICGLEPFFMFQSQSTGIRTIPCDSNDGEASGAIDSFRLVDPDSATTLLECADLLSRVSRGRTTSTVLSRDEVVERDRFGLLNASAYVALRDGTIVGLEDGDDRLPGFASCEEFPDSFKNSRSARLKWLFPDGTTGSLPIPFANEAPDSGVAPLSAIRAAGTGILVLYDSTVWNYEIARGETTVTELQTLPVAQLGWEDFVFVAGQRGIGVGANSVSVADLETGDITTVSLPVGDSANLIYADADRALIQTGGPDGPLHVIEGLR